MTEIEKKIEMKKREEEVKLASILTRVDGSGEVDDITKEWFDKYINLEISYEELGEKIFKS
ncbi:hypothetical protein [Fusobacterium varium]|uniref:hypothetical protein n=1 Tax=Fusobacterium varium TaxID=856 RepID=UPI00266BD8FB|nr:hypothetical protein [Fusobacterium varium]